MSAVSFTSAQRSFQSSFARGFFVLLILLLGSCTLLPSSLHAQKRSPLGDYQISGPYHYKNLSVFLLHGKDGFSGRKIVTLEEGLAQGFVKVYETGTVNGLEIENLSGDTEVYVQAGDIVKGGRQDRTLGIDMTLLPNSGRVPIASFCVERGRWAKRGEESASEFASSTALVASNELRLAVKGAKNQSEVWANVDAIQTKLSDNLGVQVNALGKTVPVAPADSGEATASLDALVNGEDVRIIFDETITGREPVVNSVNVAELLDQDVTAEGAITTDEILSQNIVVEDMVQSAAGFHYRPQSAALTLQERTRLNASGRSGGVATTTSLQLSLENAELIDEVEEYTAALRAIVDGHDDVIGFAFTINGAMKNADLYGSRDLFGRLWPRLLRAAATEAVAERNDAQEDVVGTVDAVRECFRDAEAGEAEREETGERIITVTRRSDENVLFETQEKNESAWLHRNYMKLE